MGALDNASTLKAIAHCRSCGHRISAFGRIARNLRLSGIAQPGLGVTDCGSDDYCDLDLGLILMRRLHREAVSRSGHP